MIPKGFLFAGVNCGIKEKEPDLGVILSQTPAEWTGMFTTNAFKAAPVLVSQGKSGNKVRAIVANSGIANAATGDKGLKDAEEMCQELGKNLGIEPKEVLVASTGVIGKPLPMEKIRKGIKQAAGELSSDDCSNFARAIMTTDKFPKIVERDLAGGKARILGIAKGAGMIHPNLATMLVFLLSDVRASSELLRRCLREAVDNSFHCLTIDGDTSTNDSLFLLANGESGVDAGEEFRSALEEVCIELAQMIAKDGEGATKLVRIKVKRAASKEIGREIGRRIAVSPLVKTALFGEDPNVGRILCALGNSPYEIDPHRVDIQFGGYKVVNKGTILDFPYEELKGYLANKELEIEIDLGMGESSVVVYTCDLSYDYVRLNAEYST